MTAALTVLRLTMGKPAEHALPTAECAEKRVQGVVTMVVASSNTSSQLLVHASHVPIIVSAARLSAVGSVTFAPHTTVSLLTGPAVSVMTIAEPARMQALPCAMSAMTATSAQPRRHVHRVPRACVLVIIPRATGT